MLGWFTPGRLVDLGAGHGAFSIRAADAGWDVTAVDARTTRFPDDARIQWIHQDVRETSLQGYDLIVNLGLFYHLTLDDQLSLLDRAAGTPMILDTHVATERAEPVQPFRAGAPARLRRPALLRAEGEAQELTRCGPFSMGQQQLVLANAGRLVSDARRSRLGCIHPHAFLPVHTDLLPVPAPVHRGPIR